MDRYPTFFTGYFRGYLSTAAVVFFKNVLVAIDGSDGGGHGVLGIFSLFVRHDGNRSRDVMWED